MAKIYTTSAGVPQKKSELSDYHLQQDFIASLRAKTGIYRPASVQRQQKAKYDTPQQSQVTFQISKPTEVSQEELPLRQQNYQPTSTSALSLQQRKHTSQAHQNVVDLHSLSLAQLKQRLRSNQTTTQAAAHQPEARPPQPRILASMDAQKKPEIADLAASSSCMKSDTTLNMSQSILKKSQLRQRRKSRNDSSRSQSKSRSHSRRRRQASNSLSQQRSSKARDSRSSRISEESKIPSEEVKQVPQRSYADQIVELHRIFKLKRIFKAWRETKSNIDRFEDSFERVLSLQASTKASNPQTRSQPQKNLRAKKIDQAKDAGQPQNVNGALRQNVLTFCVKYSDFCRCERCNAYREVAADILPESQKQLVTSQQRAMAVEAGQFDRKKDKNRGRVVPLKELYP